MVHEMIHIICDNCGQDLTEDEKQKITEWTGIVGDTKMTEEIIVDGVNVAGCQCFENDKCLWSKKYYESNLTPNCEEVKDCYYKQLQRLKQENENLKKEVKQIRTYEELKLKKYKQALEEIREIVTGNYDVLEPQAKKDIENKRNEVIG